MIQDENNVRTMTGVLNTDGETITEVKIDPTSHGLSVDDDVTGSDNGTDNAKRNENGIPALMAVSSADGVTPVAVYVDSDGKLLVSSS